MFLLCTCLAIHTERQGSPTQLSSPKTGGLMLVWWSQQYPTGHGNWTCHSYLSTRETTHSGHRTPTSVPERPPTLDMALLPRYPRDHPLWTWHSYLGTREITQSQSPSILTTIILRSVKYMSFLINYISWVIQTMHCHNCTAYHMGQHLWGVIPTDARIDVCTDVHTLT